MNCLQVCLRALRIDLNELSPGMPKSSEVLPEEYLLEENEERSMIEPRVIILPSRSPLVATSLFRPKQYILDFK